MNHKLRNDIILIVSLTILLVSACLIIFFLSKKGKYAEIRNGDEVILKVPQDFH